MTQEPTGRTVADLEREVAELKEQLAAARHREAPAPPPERGSRGRSVLSALLIVVACVLAPLSVVSVWARGEITDTDRYLATVVPLAGDPTVQASVSQRVSDRILETVDIEALTQQAVEAISANRDLTERQQAALTTLTGPLNSGIESFIRDRVGQFVRSETFATIWTAAHTRVHQQVNAALSGQDTGAISLQGEAVILDLGEVITQVKQGLVDRGFAIAANIPAVNADLVLFESGDLVTVQRGYNLLNTVGFWLPLVALAIALVGVLVANRRRVAVIGLGVGVALAMLLAGLALAVGRVEYLNALPETVDRATATVFYDTLTVFLVQALWAGVAAGVVLVLAGLVTGPARFATGVRRSCDRAAGAVQGQLASWGVDMDPVRRWVAAQATGLRIAVTVVAIGVVAIQRYKTSGLVLWTTVGLLVALFVIQVLASDSQPASLAADHAPPPRGEDALASPGGPALASAGEPTPSMSLESKPSMSPESKPSMSPEPKPSMSPEPVEGPDDGDPGISGPAPLPGSTT